LRIDREQLLNKAKRRALRKLPFIPSRPPGRDYAAAQSEQVPLTISARSCRCRCRRDPNKITAKAKATPPKDGLIRKRHHSSGWSGRRQTAEEPSAESLSQTIPVRSTAHRGARVAIRQRCRPTP